MTLAMLSIPLVDGLALSATIGYVCSIGEEFRCCLIELP